MMKTLLLLVSSFLSIMVEAQTLYVPGKVTQGENATYYCRERAEGRLIEIRNVNNTDTTDFTYYEDGTLVPNRDDEGYCPVMFAHRQSELDSILRDALTPEELEMVKGKPGHILLIYIVADISGNTQEISFVFRKKDSVFSQIDPDRFYQLEQKYKEVIKFIWHDNIKRRIRNVKYSQGVSSLNFK